MAIESIDLTRPRFIGMEFDEHQITLQDSWFDFMGLS